jgi:hypothetical protein
MHTDRTRPTLAGIVGGLAALALLVAACGGDDDDAGAETAEDTTTTTTEATTTTLDPAAEEEAARQVAIGFFDRLGAEDIEGAAALLENGEANIPKITHCANLLPGASIEVKTIEFTDDTHATLTYDLLINDEVALPDSGGATVKVDGEWLFAEASWLSLYDAAKDSCTGPAPEA